LVVDVRLGVTYEEPIERRFPPELASYQRYPEFEPPLAVSVKLPRHWVTFGAVGAVIAAAVTRTVPEVAFTAPQLLPLPLVTWQK
jgi:hypothetical protein